jgi:hypothetical protein
MVLEMVGWFRCCFNMVYRLWDGFGMVWGWFGGGWMWFGAGLGWFGGVVGANVTVKSG